MDITRSVTRPLGLDLPVAQLAKAALRRLAVERLEPTPENYARAYRLEAGDTAAVVALAPRAQQLIERIAERVFDPEGAGGAGAIADALTRGQWDLAERLIEAASDTSSESLASLMGRIVRGLEQGGYGWPMGRRKEAIHRVLSNGRSDSRRLLQRLSQLVKTWEADGGGPVAEGPERPGAAPEPEASATRGPAPPGAMPATPVATVAPQAPAPSSSEAMAGAAPPAPDWERVARSLATALQHALPPREEANRELSAELERMLERITAGEAAPALADELKALSARTDRVLQHRHHLFDQLGKLCHELTESLTDLAENDSWVKGQCDAMRVKIEEGLTARGIRAVSEMLSQARKRQAEVRAEREQARGALKNLIQQMLAEVGELGLKTGAFSQSVGRYAEVIEEADSLESLAGVVRDMVSESKAVQAVVQQTQERLQEEHLKATTLSERVMTLEDEMRRLSDEVSTDQLTQVANRRGLMQAFEIERARLGRDGGHLSIGLLDIDNFKRLNDELGHAAGDEALKSLASIVSKTLRPTDHVARYGGEEFVVMLPQTPVNEGEEILTRLQRSLTGGLFMHKEKQVFVTFSAGVTSYRPEERIEDSLERADQALYEAKHTGKNRTCVG